MLWATEAFNRSAASAKVGIIFPLEVFYEGRPSLLLPFSQLAYRRVPQQRETDPLGATVFSLTFSLDHGRDYYKVTNVMLGMVVYTRDVTRHQT